MKRLATIFCCCGNLGAGKSTLSNSFLGRAVFEAGVSIRQQLYKFNLANFLTKTSGNRLLLRLSFEARWLLQNHFRVSSRCRKSQTGRQSHNESGCWKQLNFNTINMGLYSTKYHQRPRKKLKANPRTTLNFLQC